MFRRSITSICHVALVLSFLAICVAASEQDEQPGIPCPPALFSFGTSLSDTGNRDYILPGDTFADLPPYGSSYFGHPNNRFSDGRLIVDFLASAFDFPFLEPFLTDEVPDYSYGANFAFSGCLALPIGLPYYFDVQANQFATFRARALSSAYQPLLPDWKAFDEGLYIVFFGRNDLLRAYNVDKLSPAEVLVTFVPELVQVIVDGIEKLYDNGARSFMVFNVNPQGCQPQFLTLFGDLDPERDENGCLASYNRVARIFNSLLFEAVKTLRESLMGSTIFYADFYGICKEAFDSPEKYGFTPKKTLVSCCGTGGSYNYNFIKRCGFKGIVDGSYVDVSKPCDNPSEHISWDGVHFTEAFNKHVAIRLLTGKYLDPPLDMTKTCDIDFSSFDKHHPDYASQ